MGWIGNNLSVRAIDEEIGQFEDSLADEHGVANDVGVLRNVTAFDFKIHWLSSDHLDPGAVSKCSGCCASRRQTEFVCNVAGYHRSHSYRVHHCVHFTTSDLFAIQKAAVGHPFIDRVSKPHPNMHLTH